MTYLFPFIIILILAVAAFLFLLVKKRTPSPESSQPVLDTGKAGELYTKEALQSLAGYKRFLQNCYLRKSDGTPTEADLILLHGSGIYVFESKNYSGWIFGSENQRNWTQSFSRSKKVQFYNPIWQNKSHIKWMKYDLDLDDSVPCYSFVVFSDRCELKDVPPSNGEYFVVNRRDLLEKVRKNAEAAGQRLTKEEIDTFYRRLYPMTQVSEEEKARHAETVRQKKTAATVKPAAPAVPAAPKEPAKQEERICPRCGGKLVVRTANKGERAGKQLWGCSNFPKCWFTENIEEPTSVH